MAELDGAAFRHLLAPTRFGDLDDVQRLAEGCGMFAPFRRVHGEDRAD
jgi:hypothetical protein